MTALRWRATTPVEKSGLAGQRAWPGGSSAAGFTLIELVIVAAIVGILAAAVLPLAHWSVKRQREYELQQNLRIIRNAIDSYHDLALAGLIEVNPGDTGYPPDLDVLVEGVELIGEIPSPIRGLSDEYGASGYGLTGGVAGAALAQGGGGGVGGASGGGLPGVGGGFGGGPGVAVPGGANNRALQGAVGATMQQLRGVLNERAASGFGGRATQGGLGGFGGRAVRGGLGTGQGLGTGFGLGAARGGGGATRRGLSGRASVGDIKKIVFLRRLPVDPVTGEANWGFRCYGDSIDDRSWCGRNVFDVYSNGRGRGMDGRPYREW